MSQPTNFQALLIGAGAVGIGIATALLNTGNTVRFVETNPATREAINQKGIARTGILGEYHFPARATHAYSSLAEIQQETFDYVLIAAKSAANQHIASELDKNRQVLKPGGKIVICQNGWGNDKHYRQYFTPKELYSARVITGFAKPEPNISEVTVHAAALLIGNLRPVDVTPMEPLANAIDAGGIESQATDDVAAALWAKMLYNCALNPLGAILHVNYGKLLDSANSRAIMDQVLAEIFMVMETAGYHTYWQDVEEYKAVFYGKLVPDTYAHCSSTLQDLEKKQHSEIHTLTGSLIDLAKEHNLAIPYNTMLYHLVLSIEDNF